jgi:Fe-S-cluster containining protein
MESLADLLPALQRLDAMLERAVKAAEASFGPEAVKDAYRGLYISPEDAERMLQRRPCEPLLGVSDDAAEPESPQAAAPESRLGWLAGGYGLNRFDVDVVLLALAPELDLRYSRLYAYLQDDVTRKRPSVDLALNLLCASADERLDHTASTLMALVELLVEIGLIDQNELEQRRSEIAVNLRRSFVARGMTVAVHESGFSKYALIDAVKIDCDDRLHLCRAACCRLSFALSREDLDEGALRWDFRAPYMVARGENGYCAHIDRRSCRCTAYDQRPVTCRGYDCSSDDRIWRNFEKKEINPNVQDPGWPDWVEG